jgi:predicted transcriptional regulator of viral defense system
VQALLETWDRQGHYIYNTQDLRLLLAESGSTLKQTLGRLVKSGLLIRAVRDTYVYAYSRHRGAYTVEAIAQSLRRREYNYLSYESALSEYGVISQIPIDRITVATTGRKGEFKTSFGVIEFTHTGRSPAEIIENIIERQPHPLRIAKVDFALQNLVDSGRNLDLVSLDVGEAGL